jgi:hypothetical protein
MKLRFFGKKAEKNEYNRSSTIEDLPLLALMYKQCDSVHIYTIIIGVAAAISQNSKICV